MAAQLIGKPSVPVAVSCGANCAVPCRCRVAKVAFKRRLTKENVVFGTISPMSAGILELCGRKGS